MKKQTFKSCLMAAVVLALFATRTSAQTPTDALMMEKGQLCLAAIYSHNTWDEYWEGTLLRKNGNIGTLTRQTFMPMLALGLIDKINVIAALPYVRTEASGGQMVGASGFQDWGIWLKGTALDLEAGPGNLTFHAVAGVTGKATNYLADYAPFSLGLGCTDATLRGILQYKLTKGIYARAQAGYHLRGNCKIERDYYYSDQGYYTDEVDMPNAVTYGAVLGTWLLKNSLKIEANYDRLNTLGGHDIRRQDAGFPSNKMLATSVGGGIQYYLPFVKGLGVLANYHQVLEGRNVGKGTTISAGVTYQFAAWTPKGAGE